VPTSEAATGLIDALARAAADVVTDADVLESYRFDQAAPGLVEAGRPLALARPRSTAEVQALLRVAAANRIPVVPRGAGSGLSGGANAIDGCLVLSLEAMRRIIEVDPGSMVAAVEPGVVNAELRAAAREGGAWYAPDPASLEFSTIGGNVATNAGGLCCVKYGVTRDSLLGLEVVLADGRAVRVGRRTRKGVVGYDLTGLLCGSEGTLGVITEVTVRLQPLPPPSVTVAASFPVLGAAAAATARIARTLRPSTLELMDRTTIAAVEAFQPMELDREAGAMVFACSDAAGDGGRAEATAIARICEEQGADLAVISEDEAEGRMLMAARRLAYPALERLGTTLLDDVAVPIDAIPALIGAVEEIGRRQALLIGTFGHAGDGNLHPTIVYDHGDPDQVSRARAAFGEIVAAATRLGGTASGEHGVGLLKREMVAGELGGAYGLNLAIRRALDPEGLLNPGKAL
jgi:glycolate oxidase